MPALHNVISRGLVAAALPVVAALSVVMAAPAHAALPTYSTYEGQVVATINAQRTARHLRPLWYTACPDRYAESLALRLRTSSTIYHQSLTPILLTCTANRAAENIARAPGGTSPTALVSLWMNSPGHRANILDPNLTQIGIGTTCGATMCTTVTDFIRR